jgi:hypothetical protein
MSPSTSAFRRSETKQCISVLAVREVNEKKKEENIQIRAISVLFDCSYCRIANASIICS